MIKNFVLFTSGLALLMGLGQLVKQKSSKNTLILVLFLSLCWNQFRTYSNGIVKVSGFDFILPVLTVLILTAVSSYLYFIILSKPDIKLDLKQYRLFLLTIPAFVIDVFILIFSSHIQSNGSINFFINAAHLIGGVSLIVFFVSGIINLLLIMDIRNMSIPGRFVLFISIYSIVSILVGLSGLLFQVTLLQDVSGFLFGCLLIIIFLISCRHPELMNRFKEEIRKARYLKSMLSGINKNELKQKLIMLMDNEKIYKNEECSLSFLAGKMNLTSNQLSEFLNNDMGLSYTSFINDYRINEAKLLLKENNDFTILDIAYEVGFGNKTSFNETFLKITGITPLKFRNQFLKKQK